MLWTRKGMIWISSKSTMLLSIRMGWGIPVAVMTYPGCLCHSLWYADNSSTPENVHITVYQSYREEQAMVSTWRALTAAREEETPQNVSQLRSKHGDSISAQCRPREHMSRATVYTGTAVLSQPKPAQASSTPWLLRIYLSYSEKHRDPVLIKQSKVVMGIKEYLLHPISNSPFPAII